MNFVALLLLLLLFFKLFFLQLQKCSQSARERERERKTDFWCLKFRSEKKEEGRGEGAVGVCSPYKKRNRKIKIKIGKEYNQKMARCISKEEHSRRSKWHNQEIV